MRGFSLALTALLSLVASCDGADAPPPEVGVRIQWLTGDPSAALPDDLTQLNLKLFTDDSGDFEDTGVSVENLEERDGRRILAHPLLADLPTGVPVRLVVEGLAGAELKYLGVVGPLVLSPGERRYVDLAMYQLGRSTEVRDGGLGGRFLQTGTLLPDGRVLIAGGFDGIESVATCPPELPPESRCFSLSASREAFVFQASTGSFHRVRGAMIEARAGHTATVLPGGRVLLAGGASAALFAMVPIGDPGSPRGYTPAIVPQTEDGEIGAHATFEVFLPNANAEGEDVDRDGDPARGGFTGAAASPAEPGRLNHQRFLHAAAVVPGEPARVLLAGGIAGPGDRGSSSWEIYDDDKAGGYGVYDATGNDLSAARLAPSAVSLTVPDQGRIWIFGGGLAFGNEDLAEIWAPSEDDPNGTIRPASETAFPNTLTSDETPRPEYALVAPHAASIANGTHALVVGWFGPRCAPGDSTPIFPTAPDASDTELCGHMGTRSFVVDGDTGVTRAQEVARPHAFGAIAQLTDGSVAVSGGVNSIVWMRESVVELFTGSLSGGLATAGDRATLQTGRAFHTTTPLPQVGMVTVGGLALSVDARNASLVSAPEVLYPQRAPLSRPTGSRDAGTPSGGSDAGTGGGSDAGTSADPDAGAATTDGGA